ncbi:MAG: DUF1003 domain-containing protein [Gaiellaceae bacterium]
MSDRRAAEGHHSAFGEDTFGRFAEKAARFLGTPQYIVGQTIVVAFWIVFNVLAFTKTAHFDARPFILLNLIFSTQAAYAAPLILLAQTRQADRDKIEGQKADKRHTRLESGVKTETDKLLDLLQSNTTLTQQDKDLTEQVADLTKQIHELLTQRAA